MHAIFVVLVGFVVMYCCYHLKTGRMDTDEYLKADKRNYHKLAPIIDALGFTEVNLITNSKMIFSPNKFVDK